MKKALIIKRVGKMLFLLETIFLTIVATISIANQPKVGTGIIMLVVMIIVSATITHLVSSKKIGRFSAFLIGATYSTVLIVLINHFAFCEGTGAESLNYPTSVMVGIMFPIITAVSVAFCSIVTMGLWWFVYVTVCVVIEWIND